MVKPSPSKKTKNKPNPLQKSLTGIDGFDEITNGGLPKERLSLVAGGAGNGKSLFGMQFLINGATLYNEPGIFFTFEVLKNELLQDYNSLNFNLPELLDSKKIFIDNICINPSEFNESGAYNLDGLMVRISYAIDHYKVKRVVLDTIEILFSSLTNESMIRTEIQRLFNLLKSKGVTAIVTAEKGWNDNSITRFGLEEYVADCVILLDHRIIDEVSTRRIRILKYRGSSHGENEYPFLIDKNGFRMIPITSVRLDYTASSQFMSSGVKRLDTMLDGKGFYKGSCVLITGTAGVGKSTFASSFANSFCTKGKKCLYFAFEESQSQIIRNMSSIGLNLAQWQQKGNLLFHTVKANEYGLEKHLMTMLDCMAEFKPVAVIIDPISNMRSVGTKKDVKFMLSRLVDYLKSQQITTLFTSLVDQDSPLTQEEVSALMDTWINMSFINNAGESNRVISIIKSRGMNHSTQVREVKISAKGIELEDVYMGTGTILTGSARIQQITKDKIEKIEKQTNQLFKVQILNDKQHSLRVHIEQLSTELENINNEIKKLNILKNQLDAITNESISRKAKFRGVDVPHTKK